MKKGLVLLAVVALAVYIFQPFGGEAASQVDKINKELDKVRQEMSSAAHQRDEADKELEAVLKKRDETAKSLSDLMEQIEIVGTRIMGVQTQIAKTEEKLFKMGEDLQAATERLESRDKLLQSRLRLMYTNGSVSYLDVLLNATSFSDFLDRFDSLQSILGQDRDILESHKEERAAIEVKKAEVESTLEEVKVLYGKINTYQEFLFEKEKQKEVMVLSLNEQAEALEEISDEQEKMLMELAKKVSDLEEQKRLEKKREEEERERKRRETSKPGKSSGKSEKVQLTGGKLGIPLKDSYRVSSEFGYRTHPITGKRKLHAGMDMAAPSGTSIYAAEAGTVLVAQWWNGYGNCVIIDHGNGLWTLYGHIRHGGISKGITKGATVERGQKIAEVGSTGQSTGPHLHFEVRKNETPVNPRDYLK
ncbi:murein hydrolase activator EnvC family protein [Paenibacillus sp. GCM10027626]|uniref:murein hydrolase activator EnvC family protein n=1 Tax=Paenibacillus sp. GCM10027626 TaxID=3273411 RepID=UPI00363EE41A